MSATEQGSLMITVQFRDKLTKYMLHRKQITRAFLSQCFSMRVVTGHIHGMYVIDI